VTELKDALIKDPIRPELLAAIEAAQDKQAAAITLLDLKGLGAFTDGFLLCTGFSARQVEAICDAIEERLAKLGFRHVHREGKSGADWVLLDFGSFIVHVFTEAAREYYDLERLWRVARRKDFAEPGPSLARPESAEAEG
jgi:ribosome-associated protein